MEIKHAAGTTADPGQSHVKQGECMMNATTRRPLLSYRGSAICRSGVDGWTWHMRYSSNPRLV